MCSPGINGERELRGNRITQIHLEKWLESLGLSQKDAQSRNKWRKRIKGQPDNPDSPGKNGC